MNKQEEINKAYYIAPFAMLLMLQPCRNLLEHFSFEGDVDDFDYGGSLDD